MSDGMMIFVMLHLLRVWFTDRYRVEGGSAEGSLRDRHQPATHRASPSAAFATAAGPARQRPNAASTGPSTAARAAPPPAPDGGR